MVLPVRQSSVLTCAHVGMVNEGVQCFHLMSSFGITPDVEHYGCIADLLGRAGLLDEAFDFLKKMPMEANHVIWVSLLSACRFHNKMELGRSIGQQHALVTWSGQ
jgi:pentatricopeptide repeat protein